MKHTLGLVFMIVGVVGVVLSLLLIPAVWVGHTVAVEQVGDLATTVRTPLQQAADSAGDMQTRLTTLHDNLGRISGQATSAGGSGRVEQQLAARLLQLIDQTIGPQYVQLREAYVAVRERLSAASEIATGIRGVFPNLSLPALPLDDLQALDTQLQAMDASIRQMRADLVAGSLPDAAPGVDVLRSISDGVRDINGGVGELADRANNLQNRAQLMVVQVNQAEATLQGWLTALAIVLTIICGYLGLLHVTLFSYGRSLRRVAAMPATTARAQPPAVSEPAPAPAATPSTSVGT
jgi:hypothetical protein